MDAALAQQLQRAGVEVAVQVGALDGGVRILRGERLFGIGGAALLAHIGRVGERDVKAAPSEYLGGQDSSVSIQVVEYLYRCSSLDDFAVSACFISLKTTCQTRKTI